MVKRIGFTGTQQGMTTLQIENLRSVLERQYELGAREFHHGDCIGADSQAHAIAVEIGYDVVIHPPRIETKRAFCARGARNKTQVLVLAAKDYLDRNHDIVDACNLLIATPATAHEQLRSGTWATVRYARKTRKDVLVLNPTA